MVNTELSIYQNFVTVENRWTTLYVKFQKALYGCLRSALLFYEKLVSYLKSILFIINPYDTCVANIIVNGKQMKITWHVD